MGAATLCAEPNCPNPATNAGRCPVHQLPKTRAGSTRRYRRNRDKVLARDHRICHICGLPGADSADHLQRVTDGGDDSPAHLRAAHLLCNLRRG
jgi:5-methylcytosine-specific restriction protein A